MPVLLTVIVIRPGLQMNETQCHAISILCNEDGCSRWLINRKAVSPLFHRNHRAPRRVWRFDRIGGPRIAANSPTPRVGVWERINIGVFLLWVVVLAIALTRPG